MLVVGKTEDYSNCNCFEQKKRKEERKSGPKN